MRRGTLVIELNAARSCASNCASLADLHFVRRSRASSSPPDSAGLASTMITGPTSSGWYDAIQYAMKPPMLWPTTIG